MEIGYKLKELREKNKLTQAELAKKLYITPQAISKWENNKSYPDLPTIIELSYLYKVSTDEILGLSKVSFLNQLFSKKKGRFHMLQKIVKTTLPDMYRFSLTNEFNIKKYPELQNLGLWKQIDSKTIDLIINKRSITDDFTEITNLFKVITNRTDKDFSTKRIHQIFSF